MLTSFKVLKDISTGMVSCRICGKNLDSENAANHMMQHDKRGDIRHVIREKNQSNQTH
jgi:hypothetical protein